MYRLSASIFAAVLISTFALADDHRGNETKEANQKFIKKIAGVWSIEDGVNQGRKLSAKELHGSYVKVNEEEIITYDKDAKVRYRARFLIDASKSPVQIDMTSAMKRVPPSQALGIVKSEDEGDTWVLCYALPGNSRPSEFKSPEGSNILLFKMKPLEDGSKQGDEEQGEQN